MIKIPIELEDLTKGVQLKSQVVDKLTSKGVLLTEKYTNLYSDDMPKIIALEKRDNQLELVIEYNQEIYRVAVPEVNDDVSRAGLSVLFGNGLFKHDYELPVFSDLDEQPLKTYMKLAVEVWERNIHMDWMRRCGYGTHNGTKDETFLQQILSDKWKAIKTHHERSEHGEKGDTPHHIFRNPEILRRVILSEGEDELSKYLIESIYDQATVTTRLWYEKREKPFEERLVENRDKGYFIRSRENDADRWKPGIFGFTNDYEIKLWQIWCKAHEEFKNYWIEKFGKNEEFWQPPAPIEKIKD